MKQRVLTWIAQRSSNDLCWSHWKSEHSLRHYWDFKIQRLGCLFIYSHFNPEETPETLEEFLRLIYAGVVGQLVSFVTGGDTRFTLRAARIRRSYPMIAQNRGLSRKELFRPATSLHLNNRKELLNSDEGCCLRRTLARGRGHSSID